MTKPRVLIPLAAGAEEIESVTIFDVLDRCGIEPLLLSINTCSSSKSEENAKQTQQGDAREVKLSHGLVIKTPFTISEYIAAHGMGSEEAFCDAIDGVLLPGGMPGATHLFDSSDVALILKTMKQKKKLVGAICASPAVVLAPLGIIAEGVPATCYPAMKPRFEEKKIEWVDKPVVYCKNSNILTSQGPGTTSGFALVAAALLVGSELPIRVNTAMLTHWESEIMEAIGKH